MAKSTASYRVKNTIPVCSGISGLGKSVCWKKASTTTLRDKMKLDGERIFSVIVPYYSGFIHHPVEKLMPIQASFSWRLLYRFFRDNNCPHGSKLRLLVNGHELTFASAVKAIELKLRRRQRWKVKGAPLYLFLFDEYQAIENVRAQRKQPNTSLLRELVEAIGTFLCAQSPQSPSPPSLVVLPMFAGTDWGVIQSISNSSCVQTEQLPMALFTMDQMFKIVESNANYAGLLECAQTRRGLFALGVPRWVVECLAMMKKACGQAEIASLATIKGCFSAIWSKYVSNYLNVLTPEQRIRLAASAIAGRPSWQDEAFDGTIKWSKLRDSSLCLLTQHARGVDVHVPYVLLQSVGSMCAKITTVPERAFSESLNDLKQYVDDKMFVNQAWRSWEMFGACFYAVRINALLVLGHKTISLKQLLPGALMSKEMEFISVKLVPSRVFRCANPFGGSLLDSFQKKEQKVYNRLVVEWLHCSE